MWDESLPRQDFVLAGVDRLKIGWFTELCINSKCWHIYYETFLQWHLLILPLISSEKPFNTGKLSSSGWQISFPKFSFLLESVSCIILSTNSVNCFPWNDRVTLFIFETMSTKYPSQKTTVCLSVLWSENGDTWKTKQLVQLATRSHNCFPQDYYPPSIAPQSTSWTHLISSHRILKRHILVGWVLLKLILLHQEHS